MLIRTRTGVTVDCFVAGPDAAPVLAWMPQFQPGISYGYEEFSSSCDAVVMGRATSQPGLGAPPRGLAGAGRVRADLDAATRAGTPRCHRLYRRAASAARTIADTRVQPEGALPMNLQMLRSGPTNPDGKVEIAYAPE
jgi:hypothetical protein